MLIHPPLLLALAGQPEPAPPCPAFAQSGGPGVVTAAAPRFPDIAVQARINTSFEVCVEIGADGVPLTAQLDPPFLIMKPALEAAALSWRFAPTESTPAPRRVRLRFVLKLIPRGGPPAEETSVFRPPYEVEVRHQEPQPLVNTLDSSRLEVQRLLDSLPSLRSPAVVEAYPVVIQGAGLQMDYLVEDRPVRLEPATARRLARILRDAGSYRPTTSACLFEPAVALRFRRGSDDVQALVCFKCSELVFESPRGLPLSGRMMLGAGRKPLLDAAKQAFPHDRAIQEIEE